MYNAFNVYCRELAPGTVSLTGYRAQGDNGKHCAYCTIHVSVPRNYCCVLSSFILFLFVFVALRPMSTAMVIAGRSVHLATLFPGQA